MGGTVAQQLASSVALHATDKITSNAYAAQQRKDEEAKRYAALKDTQPDPYWDAFVSSGFSTITPIVEPLPASALTSESASSPQVSRLVRVEMWNLLIGEEKISVLEKAQLLGSSGLPPKNEWQRWKVATGALAGDKNKPITFLIPPELGRISSGKQAIVEIAETGELSIARYPVN